MASPVERKGICNITRAPRQWNPIRFRACPRSGSFARIPAGRCLCVNARWAEIAGCTPADALGEGWAQALHPDDRDRDRRGVESGDS